MIFAVGTVHVNGLTLNYGPYIADAGMSYYFDCLTVYTDDGTTDLSDYDAECTSFDYTPGLFCFTYN